MLSQTLEFYWTKIKLIIIIKCCVIDLKPYTFGLISSAVNFDIPGCLAALRTDIHGPHSNFVRDTKHSFLDFFIDLRPLFCLDFRESQFLYKPAELDKMTVYRILPLHMLLQQLILLRCAFFVKSHKIFPDLVRFNRGHTVES